MPDYLVDRLLKTRTDSAVERTKATCRVPICCSISTERATASNRLPSFGTLTISRQIERPSEVGQMIRPLVAGRGLQPGAYTVGQELEKRLVYLGFF